MTHDEDTFRDLEDELSGLLPVEVSEQLNDRISDELHGEPLDSKPPVALPKPKTSRRRSQTFVVTGILAASLVASAFLGWVLWPRDESGVAIQSGERSNPSQRQVAETRERDEIRPTLIAYGRALQSSEIDLDGLLDEHANRLLPGGQPMLSMQDLSQ